EHELELNIYLLLILKDLITEKNEQINSIDLAITNQKDIGTELVNKINDTPQSNSLIIRSHTYAQEKKSSFFEHVSITQ
ncbi:35863_t:CDS:2, partial [Racocetra persica]